MFIFTAHNEQDTDRLGAALASCCRPEPSSALLERLAPARLGWCKQ